MQDHSVYDATICFHENFPVKFHGIYTATRVQQPYWDALYRALGAFARTRRPDLFPPGEPKWLYDAAGNQLRSDGQGVAVTGALLCGGSQVGKTALACMAAHCFASQAGLRPGYVNCELMKMHLRGFPGDRTVNRADYIAQADPLSFPVCVIDDLGMERGNEEAAELVNGLVYARSMAPCFTILTSNLSWRELKPALAEERLVARITREAGVIRMEMPVDMPRYAQQESA